MTVHRYDFLGYGSHVRYEDYAALERERDELRRRLDIVAELHADLVQRFAAMKDSAEAAEPHLASLDFDKNWYAALAREETKL